MRDSSKEVAVLHGRNCRECERAFSICCGCDRGHAYGSEACREEAKRKRRREASARHRKTAAGRENNARHQREHRERRRRVSDPSSAAGCPSATLPADPPAPQAGARPGRLLEDIVNFDFSKAFNEAIESKVTAEQNALAARNKLEQVKFEAEQKVAEARGKAEAITIEANALRSNPQVLDLRALEKWNGVLPQVTGGAVPFIDIR